jgi:hypothetical protein
MHKLGAIGGHAAPISKDVERKDEREEDVREAVEAADATGLVRQQEEITEAGIDEGLESGRPLEGGRG